MPGFRRIGTPAAAVMTMDTERLARCAPVAISIYYDQRGHTYFTATDITQGTTQTVRVNVGNVVYDKALLVGGS